MDADREPGLPLAHRRPSRADAVAALVPPHLLDVGQVMPFGEIEHRGRGQADQGHHLERVRQAQRVGEHAGDQRPGGEPEQVVHQGQHRERGAMDRQRREIGDHGPGRTTGAGRQEHAQPDHDQLRRAVRQRERQRQQRATGQAVGDRQAELARRPIPAQAVAEHAAGDHAHTADQHDHGRHTAGGVGGHRVVAIEVAGNPDDDGAADEQLQAAADVGPDHRAAVDQAAQRHSCGCGAAVDRHATHRHAAHRDAAAAQCAFP